MADVEEVVISSEYITLGQFLKLLKIVVTGGNSKDFLQRNDVRVNGKRELRRGRKLYVGDEIFIGSLNKTLFRISK